MNLVNHITSKIATLPLEKPSFLVAVSGGMDSMSLLHALTGCSVRLEVAHVNYHLRGEDSDLDQKTVVDYCNANKLKLHVHNADITDESGVQERAREIRYSWFNELLGESQLDYVVTAHHSNDQVETVIFNLARGTGLAGVSGMNVLSGVIFRPLLDVSQSDIALYSEEEGLPYREDKSNSSLKYSRNRIRHEIIPVLNSLNSKSVKHLIDFSEKSQMAENALKHLAKTVWDSNSAKTERGFSLELESWRYHDFSDLLIHYMSIQLGLNSSEANQVSRLVDAESGRKVLTSKFCVWKDREVLIFEAKEIGENDSFEMEISSEGVYSLPIGKLSIRISNSRDFLSSKEQVIFCPSSFLKWPLIVRSWRPGDYIQPFGMKGKQKVSDVLIQKKIPMHEKSNVLVLESGGNVIWVIGLKSSELTRVSQSDQSVFEILITD